VRFGIKIPDGLSFLASYTYSHSIDDVSSFNITGSASQPVAGENDLAQNPFNLAAERGRSMFDARQRFVLSYQWDLPFWNHPKNWYQRAFGNWQLNGIYTITSGQPFTLFVPGDGPNTRQNSPSWDAVNRPNLVGDPNAGPEMHFSFFELLAHVTRTRALTAGTILGSGTVSNADPARGVSCLAERRAREMIASGSAVTPFLRLGDHVEIEMFDGAGVSIFGAISAHVSR